MVADGGNFDGSLDALRPLRAYRAHVHRRFPALSRAVVEDEAISDSDALALSYFIGAVSGDTIVAIHGSLLGISAVHLAGLANVLEVVIADCGSTGDMAATGWRTSAPADCLGPRATAAALESWPDGPANIRVQTASGEPVELPATAGARAAMRLALIERRRRREAVRTCLDSVFVSDLHAVAIVDDCRHEPGPFVQAGIADLLDEVPGRYRFRLFCDLSPALASCNLGIVYATAASVTVEALLARFADAFSRRFDLLDWLVREQALIEMMARREHDVAEARGQIEQVRRETEEARRQVDAARDQAEEVGRQLAVALGSRTWRLTRPVRAVAERVRRSLAGPGQGGSSPGATDRRP